jgi:hypothetical protein
MYYCRLESPPDAVSTNLQLFSLNQAAKYWDDLIVLDANAGIQNVEDGSERIAFTLTCLGLSLSQLLGQNSPSPETDKIKSPAQLLGVLLRKALIDPTRRKLLNSTFIDFLSYYDAARHIGKTKDEKQYRRLDELTLSELDRFRQMTLEIWDVILAMPGNEIDFKSISEVVKFKERPKA